MIKKDISIADCKKTGTFLSLYLLLLNYCGVPWLCMCECVCVWRTLNTLFHQVWSSFFSLWWDLESNWGVKFMFEHTGTEEKEAELVVEETDAGNWFQSSPAGKLRGGGFNHRPSSSVCFFMRLYTSSRLQEHPWCRWREHSRAFQNKTWIRCSDDFQLNTYKVVMTW